LKSNSDELAVVQVSNAVLSPMPVVPKLVQAVTPIQVVIMSHYTEYFVVIAHNTEQHCGFGSALSPRRIAYNPWG